MAAGAQGQPQPSCSSYHVFARSGSDWVWVGQAFHEGYHCALEVRQEGSRGRSVQPAKLEQLQAALTHSPAVQHSGADLEAWAKGVELAVLPMRAGDGLVAGSIDSCSRVCVC